MQDGKACLILAGEQRRLLAARDELSSLLKAIKDNITTDWLQLQAWESAVFKQQALATIGSDMIADIRGKHGVWCAVDVQVGAGVAAAVDGATHPQAPQEAVHATAQVHGHTIEVSLGEPPCVWWIYQASPDCWPCAKGKQWLNCKLQPESHIMNHSLPRVSKLALTP